MICPNCGNEIDDGVKFCTKCGKKLGGSLASSGDIYSYLTLIFSIVGIIGSNIAGNLFSDSLNYNPNMVLYTFTFIFKFAIYVSIILAITGLYKHKSKLTFIAGLIPCAYFILVTLIYSNILPFLRFLGQIISRYSV